MNDVSVVILFFVIAIAGGVILLIMSTGTRSKRSIDTAYFKKEWQAIVGSVTQDPATQQFAILRADKLLDKALKDSGFSGETMAERLTSASRTFTNRDAIWTAHKLRNKIAHEDSVKINPLWTKKALRSFQRGLKDLGAL